MLDSLESYVTIVSDRRPLAASQLTLNAFQLRAPRHRRPIGSETYREIELMPWRTLRCRRMARDSPSRATLPTEECIRRVYTRHSFSIRFLVPRGAEIEECLLLLFNNNNSISTSISCEAKHSRRIEAKGSTNSLLTAVLIVICF